MTAGSGSDPRWLPSVLLGAAALATSLVAAEAVVRVFLRDRVDTERLEERLRQGSIAKLIRPSEDPELYYELRPNLDTTFRGAPVFTNDAGERVAPPDVEQGAEEAGSVRVALLGDSTAFGWGVRFEDTYGERFAALMSRHASGGVSVRNLAVPGYNAAQALAVFERRVAPDRFDLVLLHHDHNDVEETGELYPPNYFPPAYGDNPLGSALLKLTIREGHGLYNRLAALWSPGADELVGGAIAGGPRYERHLESRRRLVEAAARAGIPVVTVIFTAAVEADAAWEQSEEYLRLHRGLAERLEEMGYRVLDLYPAYQAHLAGRGWSDLSPWWVDEDDAHPNPEGHAFLAEALARFVRSDPALAARFE